MADIKKTANKVRAKLKRKYFPYSPLLLFIPFAYFTSKLTGRDLFRPAGVMRYLWKSHGRKSYPNTVDPTQKQGTSGKFSARSAGKTLHFFIFPCRFITDAATFPELCSRLFLVIFKALGS